MLIDFLIKYLRATTTFVALLAFCIVILAYPMMGFGSRFIESGFFVSVVVLILFSLLVNGNSLFNNMRESVIYKLMFLGFFNFYGLVVIVNFGYLFWASV